MTVPPKSLQKGVLELLSLNHLHQNPSPAPTPGMGGGGAANLQIPEAPFRPLALDVLMGGGKESVFKQILQIFLKPSDIWEDWLKPGGKETILERVGRTS